MRKNESIEDAYALTPLQEGLLFHSVLHPGGGQYHDQFSAVLRGALREDKLQEAWRAVVAATPVFRTAFSWRTGGAPLQVVLRNAEAPLRLLDWRELAPEAQAARRARLLEDDVRESFDLARPPLARATLVRLADDAWFFLWSRHHLLLDGWSVTLVLRAWLGAYRELCYGRAPVFPPARPFRDYVDWLKRRDDAAAETFWKAELADLDETPTLGLALPPGSPPPADGPRHGEREIFLEEDESEAIRQAARAARVTPATFLQGAWGLLLARLSGEREAVFGHIVSGRPPELPGVEGIIGLFINAVPLRVRVQPAEKLEAWLQRIQERTTAARDFEHTPLVKVHGWTGLARDRPLFETLLVVENYPADQALADALEGVRVAEARSHERTHYAVTLIATPGRRLALRLLHDRARVTEAQAERWLDSLRTLLARMAHGATEPVGRLGALGTIDAHRLLIEWNDTARPLDRAATLTSLVVAQVARTPDKIAVDDGKRRLTYAELSDRARALARRLRVAGAGPEKRIGVCLDRSVDLVVALLGVLESGAAYVPLDPAYPPERLAYMSDDARLTALITQAGLEDRVPATGVPVVRLDEAADEVSSLLLLAPRPANLAYLIYTSGSTGRPKGTAIEHRQAATLVQWALATFAPRELAGVLFSTSMCFDLSVFELFVTLAAGGKIIVAENALALPTHPARGEVTLVNTVPSAAAELARQEALPASVITICLAGEPLSAVLADRLYAFPSVERVRDLYGPSEDTTYSTNALRERGGPATIGRVIEHSRLYLLDDDMLPAPVGAIGEIHLAGEGLARGYLGRPELTAERFVPDPFSPEPGGRLYRTGDLARFRDDGQIEFLGRRDHQVKIRGFRIEMGEIQARLEAHPDVAEAAVLAREHAVRGKYLVAFVAPKPGVTLASAALAAWTRDTLPVHMTPSAWHLLPQLPRTPNGKLDRRALPADTDGPGDVAGEVAPRPVDPIAEMIGAIWAQVLGAGAVRATDHFFELGGHSLLATQAIARVRSALKTEVALKTLFEHPVLGDFVAAVRAQRLGDGSALDAPIARRPEGEAPVPSFAQERMWTIAKLSPDRATYNLPAVIAAKGPLDVEKLRRALDEVVARHEALRTAFPERDGRAAAVIAPARALDVPVIDLSALPEAAREAEARRLAAEEAGAAFDLERGPLLRARVLRLGERRHWLLLTVHHIATDGWSEWVLVQELGKLYAGETLESPGVGYGDYARWQRARVAAGDLARQVAWWQETLQGVPPIDLPIDGPRPTVVTQRGGQVAGRLDEVAAEKLRAVARAEGATLFMALLAAWEVWVWRHSGQEDFGVGVPVAGRTRRELEGMIGLFVNTIVVRSDVAARKPFKTLLQQVRERTLHAYDRQEAPFEQVVEAVQPERDTSRTPLFQVMFSVQNTPKAELAIGEVTLEPIPLEGVSAKFELTLTAVEEKDGTVALNLEYNRDLFAPATAERFLRRYETIVRAVGQGAASAVADLAWVPAAERAEANAWARGAAAPGYRSVVDAVLAIAAATPERIAVAMGAERITYAQLIDRAGAIAARLAAAGVRRGAPVAVFAERTPELAAALFGVWLAGGAYAPLDPEHPAERLRAIVADNGLAAVLLPAALRARLPAGLGVPIVVWDEAGAPVVSGKQFTRPAAVAAPAIAYLLFTSGSTGQPKGVAISHGALANHMAWFNAAYGFGAGDVVLQKTSFTFDASVWEFWAPLMTGGRLEFAAPGGERDPAYLARAIQASGATVLQAVPSLFGALAATPEFAACTSLRILFSGGEALTTALRDRLAAARSVPLVNLYGPTEATIECATWTCGADDGAAGSVPIGRAVPGCALYVVDDALRPVPPGIAGDLFVGGAQLATGYWRRAELTAEAFVPDPFAETPGARMYRTGDRVRWRADGALEYLSRNDGQVKVRGFRIELGETEAALLAQAGVRRAVAAVRAGRLIGYVEWPAAPSDWRERLRATLEARLPRYMVPALFVAMEVWPFLSSGKVDRRALPEPEAPVETSNFVAPEGRIEILLAGLWSELLRVPRVGRHDNFFALGGDSIVALQVAARAAVAGVRVPAQAIFAHQSLAELAAQANEAAVAAHGGAAAIGEAVPLTPIQHWFFEQAFAAPEHWNQSVLFVAPPEFESARFAEALRRVTDRHEAFHLRFTREAGGWTARRAASETSVTFESAPLAKLRGGADQAQAGLDLAHGPLVRAVHFFAEGGVSGRLLLVAHHLAVDAVSWRFFLGELAAAYAQPEQPLASVPPWAPWPRALADEARRAETVAELPYWRGIPASAPLPRDFAVVGLGTVADEAEIVGTLTAEETRPIVGSAETPGGAQANELLLAALAAALRDWTGARGHTIAIEAHGREEFSGAPPIAGAVGWFTTFFPLRIEATEHAREGAAVVARALRAVPRRGFGHGLLRHLGLEEARAALRAAPWPELCFNYLGQFDAPPAERGLALATESRGADRSARNTRSFLIEINVAVRDGALHASCLYHRAHHREATVRRLADNFLAALRGLTADGAASAPVPASATPANFSAADLSAGDLTKILGRLRR